MADYEIIQMPSREVVSVPPPPKYPQVARAGFRASSTYQTTPGVGTPGFPVIAGTGPLYVPWESGFNTVDPNQYFTIFTHLGINQDVNGIFLNKTGLYFINALVVVQLPSSGNSQYVVMNIQAGDGTFQSWTNRTDPVSIYRGAFIQFTTLPVLTQWGFVYCDTPGQAVFTLVYTGATSFTTLSSASSLDIMFVGTPEEDSLLRMNSND